MFGFLIGNLTVITILYLISFFLAIKYCSDDREDIWDNEKAEKVYYKIIPTVLIQFLIEFVVLIVWCIKIT